MLVKLSELPLKKFFLVYVGLALLIGFIWVNYIDATGINYASPTAKYYHIWLTTLYFILWIGLARNSLKDWKLWISLGLTTSLANDGLWGFWQILIRGFTAKQFWYWAYNWYVPTGEHIFNLLLGVTIPVYSWEMAATIYGRIICVVALLYIWWREP